MREIIVRVKNKEQLAAVIGRTDISGIILEFGCLPLPEIDKLLWTALPDVAREQKLASVRQIIERGTGAGFVIKNLDELELLEGFEGPLLGDAFLYAYNTEALQLYLRLFPQMQFIAPDELTDDELAALEKRSGVKFIYKIYGYQQLMITNQCLNRNYFGCEKPRVDFADEKGNKFTMTSECGQCYDVVYNGLPTSMLDKDVQAERVLYDFTLESASEVSDILDRGAAAVEEFTRGHHFKGID